MSKTMITPVAAAVGFALAGSLSVASLANAAENPFSANQLSQGYLQLADAKMGEGKCGGEKKAEAKCGGEKKAEGKCGGEKKTEGKCGGEKMPAEAKQAAEGKCGEGKCGGAK